MVASNDTVDRVFAVVERHVDRATLSKILTDLTEVPGNKSFRDTIERLVARSHHVKPSAHRPMYYNTSDHER